MSKQLSKGGAAAKTIAKNPVGAVGKEAPPAIDKTPIDNTLKVIGCNFMPQMRVLCILLKLNNIKFESFDVNIFND